MASATEEKKTKEKEVVPLPKVKLVDSDGEPLDSSWQREAIGLLVHSIFYHFRARTDFHVGGNNFIYFNLEQARKRNFKGPDFFFVKGVRFDPLRRYWVVWEEGGKYPNVITELLSPSSAKTDLTTKKDVYEQVFRTPEYFCYEPDKQELLGWRLNGSKYQPLQANEQGWLWSDELELWLGNWTGTYEACQATWLRFYDREGKLVLIPSEAEALRAGEAHRQAADAQQRAQAEALKAAEAQQQAQVEAQRAADLQQQLDAAKAEILRVQSLAGKK